jgi:hypothetical protein
MNYLERTLKEIITNLSPIVYAHKDADVFILDFKELGCLFLDTNSDDIFRYTYEFNSNSVILERQTTIQQSCKYKTFDQWIIKI